VVTIVYPWHIRVQSLKGLAARRPQKAMLESILLAASFEPILLISGCF